jgi:hypothetical protein
MAGRAQSGCVNLIRRHAGRFEAIARDAPEIEIPVSGSNRRQSRHRWIPRGRTRRRLKPSVQCRLGNAGGPKAGPNIGSHLVAAWTDRRAEGDDNILRPAGELPGQRVYHRRGHACDEPPPSGVRGGDDTRAAVNGKQRKAVGGLHGHGDARVAINNDVGIRR